MIKQENLESEIKKTEPAPKSALAPLHGSALGESEFSNYLLSYYDNSVLQ